MTTKSSGPVVVYSFDYYGLVGGQAVVATHNASTRIRKQTMFARIGVIDRRLKRMFWWVGVGVGRNYRSFLIWPVVLAVIASSGLLQETHYSLQTFSLTWLGNYFLPCWILSSYNSFWVDFLCTPFIHRLAYLSVLKFRFKIRLESDTSLQKVNPLPDKIHLQRCNLPYCITTVCHFFHFPVLYPSAVRVY